MISTATAASTEILFLATAVVYLEKWASHPETIPHL